MNIDNFTVVEMSPLRHHTLLKIVCIYKKQNLKYIKLYSYIVLSNSQAVKQGNIKIWKNAENTIFKQITKNYNKLYHEGIIHVKSTTNDPGVMYKQCSQSFVK